MFAETYFLCVCLHDLAPPFFSSGFFSTEYEPPGFQDESALSYHLKSVLLRHFYLIFALEVHDLIGIHV